MAQEIKQQLFVLLIAFAFPEEGHTSRIHDGKMALRAYWRIEPDNYLCVDWRKLNQPYCLEMYTDGERYAVRNPRLGDQLFPVILIQGDRRR